MTLSSPLYIFPAIIFAVSLVLGLFLVDSSRVAWDSEQSLSVSDTVSTQAANFERRLSRSLSSTYILKSLLELNHGELPEFERHAQSIIDTLGGITNLQLAPNGVIDRIYPLDGHEKALGLNILRDDQRSAEANLAAKTGDLTLAGPFKLIQGGTAVIGRNPVYIQTGSNEKHFWGFASALIYLDELLEATELNQLKDKGYLYQLTRISPNGSEEVISSNDPDAFNQLHPLITRTITVPNGKWELRMGRLSSPRNAIINYLKLFIVILTSALLACLGYSLLKQPIVLQEMVDQKTAELKQLAFYDPLTSLCNRRLFTDLLNQALSELKRNDSTLALLYLDLDQFKRINDSMGHEAGDRLLKETAHRLKSNLRQSDVVARIGGDEFCVLISQIKNAEDIGRAAKKIQKLLKLPLEINNQKIIVTPSIGIALAPNDGTEGSMLLRNADMAMYSAKNRGRNNYQFYNPQMNKKVMGNLTLESELGRALVNNEFVLHYQTQVSLTTNEAVAMEALIRWQHPDRGLVFPDSFIQLAEDTSLIIPIGKWVLYTACTQLKALNIPHLKVAVNLSAIQFNDPNLIDTIKTALQISGLDASKLELEITESLLMDNIEHAIQTLSDLKSMGITIAIDDFGTGYSSLAQLKNLPADILKIDREFVKDATTVMENAEITEVIISMGHKLGMKVVAEGVETEEQLAFLVEKGCDIAQGYLFCRPESLDVLQANASLDVIPSYGKSSSWS